MTPLVSEMVKIAPEPELYQWFDASALPAGHLVNLDVVNESPLPFPLCAVVGLDGDSKWLLLLRQEGNTVACAGWVLHATGYDKHPPFTYLRSDRGLGAFGVDGEQKATDDSVRGVLATVGGWLQSLHAGSVAHVPTPRPSFINSKRAAKGKGPVLFDWHTVTVAPTPAKGESQGGSHASPRAHERRGHWRTYASGKKGWVKNCHVGDASRGAVFKDYEVQT